MPTPPLSEELAKEAADALSAFLGNKTHAADFLKIPRTTLQSRLKRAAELGMLGTQPVLEGFAIKSIASKTEDGAWIKQTKEHGSEWEVPAGHTVKGVSALVDAEGRGVDGFRRQVLPLRMVRHGGRDALIRVSTQAGTSSQVLSASKIRSGHGLCVHRDRSSRSSPTSSATGSD